MNFCQDHWDKLREAIKERGLSDLIAPSGETAVAQLADELKSGEKTALNYDPLMGAMFAIANNVGRIVGDVAGSAAALYVMVDDGREDDPVDPSAFPPEMNVEVPEGATWPRCPLCYLGLAHELTCRDEACTLPKKNGYDWMIDRAADDAQAEAVRLKLIEQP